MPQLPTTFRSRRRAMSRERGRVVTITELAPQAGITREYLSAIERGTRFPSEDLLVVLADVYETTPEALRSGRRSGGGDQKPTPPPKQPPAKTPPSPNRGNDTRGPNRHNQVGAA